MSLPFSTNPMTMAENIRKLDGFDSTVPVDKIPKDYSTTEQNTGVKWIDGNEIYFRVIPITTPTTSYENVAQIANVDKVVDIRTILFDNTAYFCENRHLNTRYNINGNIVVTASTSTTLQGIPAWIYIYYTKSAATREPDEEPENKKVTKRKTTKKEEE